MTVTVTEINYGFLHGEKFTEYLSITGVLPGELAERAEEHGLTYHQALAIYSRLRRNNPGYYKPYKMGENDKSCAGMV